jgi:hypothetical protein
MIQAFLIKPYSSLEPIVEIPLTSTGITEAKLAIDISNDYILSLGINQSLGQLFFDLKSNRQVGIKLVQTINGVVDWELAFLKADLDQEDTDLYSSKLKFRSLSVWLENYSTRQIPFYTNYLKTKAGDIVNGITTNINFDLIGNNPEISIQTGELNSKQLLDETINTVGNWAWFNSGISGNKPTIKIGNLTDLPITGEAKAVENCDITDLDTIRIMETPEIRYNGKVATHTLVMGSISSGSEAGEQSRIFLDRTINTLSGFPLVDLGERTATNRTLFRILNQDTFDQIGYQILEQDVIEFSSNLTDPAGVPIINIQQAKQSVYNQEVAKMKRDKFYVSYGFKFSYPKVYLAGSKILVNYTGIATTANGDELKIELKDFITYIKNTEYNLLEYV